METMEISSGIVLRINLGNFQHIELIKSNKKVITYSDDADRIRQEDIMTNELVECLKRDMTSIPARLGKVDAPIAQVEESIKKSLPEWLAKSAVPNIADPVAKREIQVTAEQKNALDNEVKKQSLDVDDKKVTKVSTPVAPSPKPVTQIPLPKEVVSTAVSLNKDEKAKVDDLFDEIEPSPVAASKVSEPSVKKDEVKPSVKKDEDDFNWD